MVISTNCTRSCEFHPACCQHQTPLFVWNKREGRQQVKRVRRPANVLTPKPSGNRRVRNMKQFLLIISLLIASVLRAGDEDSLPPHELATVSIIEQYKARMNTTGFVARGLDSIQVTRFLSADIGRLFDQLGMVNVTTYGAPGGAVLARSNGLAPDHTVLFWRGLPLNSPTLGMADLSLVPVFFFPTTNYNVGVSLSTNTRSALAANIGLSAPSLRRDRAQVEVFQEYSSLKNSFTGAGAYQTFGKWVGTIKVFYSDLKNEYKFTDIQDYKPIQVVQKNHRGQNWGTFTEWRREGKHSWNLTFWNVERGMKLPNPIGLTGSMDQYQDDRQIRFIAEHNTSFFKERNPAFSSPVVRVYRLMQSVSYLRDEQWYRSEGASAVNSHVQIDQGQIGNTLFVTNSKNSLLQTLALNTNTTRAVYDGTREVNMNSVYGNAGANWHTEKFQGSFSVGGEIREALGAAHALASSVEFVPEREGRHYAIFGLSVSQRMRLPDMNELYWEPGGNPDLKPEVNNNVQLIFTSSGLLSKHGEYTYDFKSNASYSEVSDWIQWIPMGNLWSPVNYKDVHVKSAEVDLTLTHKHYTYSTSLTNRYQLTDAKGSNGGWNEAEIFDMVYTPRHRFYTELNQAWKKINFSVAWRYVGQRETDESNNAHFALAAYQTWDASVAWLFQWKNSEASLRLRGDNLMNVTYQSVRGYAQPGRVISLQLHWRWHHEKKQEQEIKILDNKR